MIINPHRRAASARLMLDGITSLDLDDHGTDEADDRTLLALRPLGLDLENEPKAAAALAGALDLLWFLTYKQAQEAGVSHEELISNMRQHLLPRMYPDVYGEN